MRVVVDTSILIDHLRGFAAATRWLQAQHDQRVELLSSVVVRTEILAGMRPNEKAKTQALLDLLQWLDVSAAIADGAGELASRYHRSHPTIDLADYLLAATASTKKAELRTMNIKHFPMFPALSAPYDY